MRRILVTGSSGLIGARLNALAGESSIEVVPAHRGGGTDIRDRASLEPLVRGDDHGALIHLAAFTDVSAAFRENGDESGDCYQVNVVGTENVAAVCGSVGLPWVHVSTDFVFSGEKDTPYTEDDAPDPIEWYGSTKLKAEEIARQAGATIVRISFPYSTPPAPKPDLVRWILGALRDGKELQLFNDQVITPTFADDIASGLLALAAENSGGTFHLSGGEATTPYDLGCRIAQAFGCDEALVQASSLVAYLEKDPRPRQRALHVSNERWCEWAKSHGLTVPLTIDEGLARVRAAE